MKIIALADIHGRKRIIQKINWKLQTIEADCIIIAGDIAKYMSIEEAAEILSEIKKLELPVIYVPGNMDNPKLIEGVNVNDTYCIHGRSLNFKGYILIGVGGALKGPFRTPLEYAEEEIMEILKSTLNMDEWNKVILVTHTPPFNTNADRLSWGEHVGSKALRKIIEEKEPIINICGHIHEARGKDKIKETLIVNPGPAMQGYYSKIEISENDVKVEMLRI
ncbi:MAG: hypothetical protein DRJ30_06730 [Candidatus Methanomethylicota archaeon]|nr:MAG: hypothetical protein DRJ30_06730 [Candidatus Verstraetearchaeota archaeon]